MVSNPLNNPIVLFVIWMAMMLVVLMIQKDKTVRPSIQLTAFIAWVMYFSISMCILVYGCAFRINTHVPIGILTIAVGALILFLMTCCMVERPKKDKLSKTVTDSKTDYSEFGLAVRSMRYTINDILLNGKSPDKEKQLVDAIRLVHDKCSHTSWGHCHTEVICPECPFANPVQNHRGIETASILNDLDDVRKG